jgi:hypothetical protein
MSKTAFAASAVVVLCLASLSAYYISSQNVEAQRQQTAALEQDVAAFQQQLAEARKEIESLRTGLADGRDENLKLEMEVAKTQDELASFKREKAHNGPLAFHADKLPAGVGKMVQGLLKNADIDVDEVIKLGALDPDAAPANPQKGNGEKAADKDEEAKKKGFTVRRFKLPGGGEGKIVTRMMTMGADEDMVKELENGKVQIREFDIGNGQGKGQVIIRLDGNLGGKEPKPQEPPKVKEDF